MNDRFWELLGKHWSDQISSVEKAELEQMLMDHPDYWLKMGMLERLGWKRSSLLSENRIDYLAEKAIQSEDQYNPERKRKRLIWRAVAAIGLILLTAGTVIFLIQFRDMGNKLVWRQTTTTDGMKTMLRLADGTQLWLNAGSTLRYPEDFDNKTREVYLSGEAYFKVMHDAERPFIVHTSEMEVKVLGTEINVRAYKEEKYSSTTLINGAVEVVIHKNSKTKTVVLRPHQKIEVMKDEVVLSTPGPEKRREEIPALRGGDTISAGIVLAPVTIQDSLISEVAWKENTLLFENETLRSLAFRLERWYGVTIEIKDSALANERFTGRADNVSVEKLLHILQLLKPFHYTTHDKKIVIDK